jgi:hypothetical protein
MYILWTVCNLLLDAASRRFLKKILPLGGAGHHRAHPSQVIAKHTLRGKQKIIKNILLFNRTWIKREGAWIQEILIVISLVGVWNRP